MRDACVLGTCHVRDPFGGVLFLLDHMTETSDTKKPAYDISVS